MCQVVKPRISVVKIQKQKHISLYLTCNTFLACNIVNYGLIFTENTKPIWNTGKTISCCLVAKFTLTVVTALHVTTISVVGRGTVYNR